MTLGIDPTATDDGADPGPAGDTSQLRSVPETTAQETPLVQQVIDNLRSMASGADAAVKQTVVKGKLNEWMPVILLVGAWYLARRAR